MFNFVVFFFFWFLPFALFGTETLQAGLGFWRFPVPTPVSCRGVWNGGQL